MDYIMIGKPYIMRVGEYSRLCAEISEGEQCKKSVLYYEVERDFEKYLNIDNSDTFVLGLLHNAMNIGRDIICEGGVTSRLMFQINNYYIPVICEKMPDLKFISVSCREEGRECKGSGAVMTGCSGGVDSFYTMLKYKDIKDKEFSLTHVLFNNISTADNDDNRIRQLFERDVTEKKQIAKEQELTPVMMYTNLYRFYSSQYIYNYYFASQYVSASFALGRLVSNFYFSSGVSVADFSMDHRKIKDGAYFDLFSLSCFSNDYISVYSAGSEVSRFEKTKFICGADVVKKHLQVCSEEQYMHFYENGNAPLSKLNCGCCGKCRRTITTLYTLGCLEDYEGVFDLTIFNKNKEKFIAQEFADDATIFTDEIKKNLHSKELNFGKIAIYKKLYIMRRLLRKSKALRKVYRRIKYGKNRMRINCT